MKTLDLDATIDADTFARLANEAPDRPTSYEDPIVERLCPTCEKATAKYHRGNGRLLCLNRECEAFGRIIDEAAILEAYEDSVDPRSR